MPSLAVKILRDHKPSINWLAMESMIGSYDSHNFFGVSLSTDTSTKSPYSLNPAIVHRYAKHRDAWNIKRGFVDSFNVAMRDVGLPSMEPLHIPTDSTFNGLIEKLSALGIVTKPDAIEFEPSQKLRFDRPGETTETDIDFRIKLSSVPIGVPIYSVKFRYGNHSINIASIVLDTPALPSFFGDRQLFFQHDFSNAH
jgi:hypothetical protein